MMKTYIGGTFDILNVGHVKLLQWAKRTYGHVTVALNSDAFVERYKGKKPLMSYDERRYILQALSCVDDVVPNIEDEDSRLSVTLVRPNVIIGGSDWDVPRLMKQMNLSQKFVDKLGIDVVIYTDSHPVHSSDIKKRMAQ